MEHLVFIAAQLLPNCTAGEIKAQGVIGQAQPGPTPYESFAPCFRVETTLLASGLLVETYK